MLKIAFSLLGFLFFFQAIAQEARVYKENEKWGLLTAESRKITEAIYDQIIPGVPYSVVKKYNASTARYQVGCVNESGELVIPLAYVDLKVEGMRILACQKNQQGFVYGVISLKNEIIIPIQYKSIHALGTLRFAAENQEGKFALFTEEGKPLTDFTIERIQPFKKELSVFEQNGLVGLLDRNGTIKVEATYRDIFIQADGSIVGRKPTTWQWITEKNIVKKTIEADSIISITNKLFIVKNRKGFALLTDQLKVVSSYFTELSRSKDTSILLVKNQKHGALQTDGQVLLPCLYDSVYLDRSFIYAKTEKGWLVFSHAGKLLNERGYEQIATDTSITLVKKNGFWGALNEKGKEQIACVYDSILQSNDRQLSVRFKGMYGIISATEQWLVPPQLLPLQLVTDTYYLMVDGPLRTVKDFSNNTLYFTNNPLTLTTDGFIETTSSNELWHVSFTGVITKWQQKPQDVVSTIGQEHEGYRSIQKDNKWGFIDAQGRLRIPNRYDAVQHFSEGLAPFSLRKKWGFINREDEIVIQPAYEEVQPFVMGLSLVKQKGKYGIINKANEFVLPCRYDSVKRLPSGFFELINDNLRGLANREGVLQYDPKYTLQVLTDDYVLVERNGKYGVLTKNGMNVIPTMYDYISTTQDLLVFLIMRKSDPELLKL